MSGGRSAQRKGREAERDLAQFLRDHGLPDAHPGAALNYGTQPDVIGLPNLHIECKRHETLELARWYEQAQQDAQRMADGLPAVIFRQNRRPWMICLALSDYLTMTEARPDGL